MLGRRDTASAMFFDCPSSALESALQANTHTHVVRAVVRIFSSGGVRATIQNVRHPVRALRLRVGDLHLPGHVVRHAVRALRLHVDDLHLPGVRFVSALVIYFHNRINISMILKRPCERAEH